MRKMSKRWAPESECGCLTDGQDAGGLKTFKSRTRRNQLMYRKPLEFLHKSAHGAKQNSGDYFSLPLMGKSQENMSQ